LKTLSEVKKKILKLIWTARNPVTTREIAEKTDLKVRSANMHLLVLRKFGLVRILEGGYVITEEGKEIIGFPKIDKIMAKKILSRTHPENAFYFYLGADQPLGISSESLVDLYDKVKTVDIRSIEFHMARGDLERWINYLGDIELAERLKLIKEANLTGEALRDKLYETLKFRCNELLGRVANS
jgi:DNA-binding transcriptional ArsR family regulator